MPAPSDNPLWSPETKRVALVISLLTVAALIYISRSALSLVIWAAILAYIFQPLVIRLERLRVPRTLGALLVIGMIVLVVALVPILLIPALIEQAAEIWEQFPMFSIRLLAWVQNTLQLHPLLVLGPIRVDLAGYYQQLSAAIQTWLVDFELPAIEEAIAYTLQGLQTASGFLGTATGLATSVANAVIATSLAAVFLLMYTFYMVKDGPGVRSWGLALISPTHQVQVGHLFERISRVWASFFRGQITLSLTVGVLTTIILSLIGMPGALVLGIIAGLFEVIPNLGPLLAMIPALILALFQGSATLDVSNLMFTLIVLLIYIGIQQVENIVLVPRIMGQSLNLHPMLVILGVAVGAASAGILGAFLAAPVLATLRQLALYAHAKLLDRDPFAEPLSEPALIQMPGPITRLVTRWKAGRGRQPDLPNETDGQSAATLPDDSP